MSMDKWLASKESKEEKIKRDRIFKSLSKEKKDQLKKRKIQDLTLKEDQKSDKISIKDEFLSNIIEFKNWLNERTYLKGDIDKIETWIKNLYLKIKLEDNRQNELYFDNNERKELLELYKKIPPKFLDEKTRIALNKKLYGGKKSSSDYYFLKKLKENIDEKLREAEYFEILKKIL
jgi:hypothetical protein